MHENLPMPVQRALDECGSLDAWLRKSLGHDDGSPTILSLEVIRRALVRHSKRKPVPRR